MKHRKHKGVDDYEKVESYTLMKINTTQAPTSERNDKL